MQRRCHDCDVAVVGAGLAGLAAATELERAGAPVAVLEAHSEVGGRARSRPLGGAMADLAGSSSAHSTARCVGWSPP